MNRELDFRKSMFSPHLDKVFQIADALRVPARDLFDRDSAPHR
ncbi:hypothetical protein ACFWY5_56840 [Nonomuraea sp. NPDC059007]